MSLELDWQDAQGSDATALDGVADTAADADADRDVNADAEVSPLLLEDWLQQVAAAGQSAAAMAEAMISDGVAPAQAQALAAAAVLRHGPMSLHELLTDERGREAAALLRRWSSEAAVVAAAGVAPVAVRQLLNPADIAHNRLVLPDRDVDVLLVSHSPRLAVFGNLLSEKDCEALITLGRERLAPDRVVDRDSNCGADVLDVQTRNSYGCCLEPAHGEVVRRVEQRVIALVNGQEVGLEKTTLSRYLPGQKFEPHFDYFDPQAAGYAELVRNDGQRIATLVVYLSEVGSGGGTLFPDLGVEVRPQRGGATYFTYQREDGSADPSSLHGGAPVLAGEKWIATFWFRECAAC